MSTYHVKISGDDVTGDGSEGNPWRTISYGVSQLTAGGPSFDSSPDELLVHYDASTAYVESVLGNVQGATVLSVDSAGVRADAGGWNREERALVAPSSGAGLRLGDWTHWIGFELDGSSAGSSNGIEAVAADVPALLEDLLVHDWAQNSVGDLDDGSIVERVEVHDGAAIGIYAGSAVVDVRACLVTGCAGTAGIRALGTGALVEQCTVIGCGDGAAGSAGIDANELGGVEVRNCIALDNDAEYGIKAAADATDRNCSYHSSASYHTLGDYRFLAGKGFDIDLDPLLDTQYRPTLWSPCRLTGSTLSTTVLDVDLEPFATAPKPSRGALSWIGSTELELVAEDLVAWSGDAAGVDILSPPGTEPFALDRDTLRAAVLASLFSDRRADPDDDLPGGNADFPRGWWADSVDGSRYGSRLWLLERAPLDDGTANLTEGYVLEALQWLLDDGVATELEVSAERVSERIELEVAIVRDGRREQLRWSDLWEALYE